MCYDGYDDYDPYDGYDIDYIDCYTEEVKRERERAKKQKIEEKSAKAFERRMNDYIRNVLKDGRIVYIPDNITEIPEGAFKDNQVITEVHFHENVKHIADSAFENCQNLKKVVFGAALMRIGEKAFYHCSMTEISLPFYGLTIGQSAFEGCSNLCTINFISRSNAEELFYHGDTYKFKMSYECDECNECNGFNECDKCRKIKDEKGWGKRAFADCVNLKEIIGFKLGSMGEECFAGCRELKEVKADIGLIGDYAFKNCYSLKIVELSPSSVQVDDKWEEICEEIWGEGYDRDDVISIILGDYAFPYNKYSLFSIPPVKKYGLGFDGYDENVKKCLLREPYDPYAGYDIDYDVRTHRDAGNGFSTEELADYYGYDKYADEDYGYDQFLDNL